MPEREPEHIETVVIGGGQAGLSVGHHLARRGRPFLILDANQRVGDAWRNRWDSLRLFTPARYDALAGMPFPAPAHSFPTKDQVADYLEAYATQFQLPVRTGVRVDRLWRDDGGSWSPRRPELGGRQCGGRHVDLPGPLDPPFAGDLSPAIVQLHSAGYRNPSQLQDGGVLVVGAGNSGAEIALEVAGRPRPGWRARSQAMSRSGSRVRRRGTFSSPVVPGPRPSRADRGHADRPQTAPEAAVPRRAAGPGQAQGSRRRRNPARSPGSSGCATATLCWPTNGSWRWPTSSGAPGPVPTSPGSTSRSSVRTGTSRHHRGVVANQPGLYFVGLSFLYAMSSGFLPGVDRDAEHIVHAILAGGGRTSDRPGPTTDNDARRPMRSG